MTSETQPRGHAAELLATKVVDVRSTAISQLIARAAVVSRLSASAGTESARLPVAAFDASL